MRIALVFASLLMIAACQKKGSVETGSGSDGSGSQSKPTKPTKRTTLDIKLPALSGKPPVKTTAPITKANLDKLGEIRFEDFGLEMNPYSIRVAIRQRAQLKPRMSVNIDIAPCKEKLVQLVCRPLTVDAWRADEADLKKQLFDAKLADRPDSTFEIGAGTIGGTPAIYVYQAGQFFGKDENQNPVGSYAHAYTLFYNDGMNQIRVTATYSDNPHPTLEEMKRALPRPFLEKAATAFLDAYVQAWPAS